ncbi:PREDICTED: protein takeout-like [Dinoponera quadriceps]|uniref:Protein takeout-like n=1 Tax=Dinoponera quadriceps TaxID=609295 RepID=A0A6P3XXA5_DINQU|nr:PREDICTED: protein takeout-like [Dinoponera quadriceps]
MKTTVVLLSMVVMIMAVDFPSGFKVCKLSDPNFEKCYIEAAKIGLNILAKGDNTLGILPLEPIVIGNMTVQASGPVAVKHEYWNMKVYGLTKNLQITIKNFNKNTLANYKEVFYPYFYLLSNYKLDGKILLLPIHGEGKCKLMLHNSTITFKETFVTYEKDGETYIKFKKYDFRIKEAKLEMQFENLFGGDARLGETMNKFINENSKEIFDEVKPAYEKVFSDATSGIFNKIFSQIPLRKIFPPE